MTKRPLTLLQAVQVYPNRFTMEHVPAWARVAAPNGLFYKPQFASDLDWYNNTMFPGEGHIAKREKHCQSRPTWPLGEGFSGTPYRKESAYV